MLRTIGLNKTSLTQMQKFIQKLFPYIILLSSYMVEPVDVPLRTVGYVKHASIKVATVC